MVLAQVVAEHISMVASGPTAKKKDRRKTPETIAI